VLHRRDPDRFEEPEELGFAIVGPVATAFTSWLVQRPELPTLDALGFLAREGLLLREMYQRATALDPGRLPRAEYIEVSRRAAIGAALGAADSPCPELVLRGASFTGTIGDLLEARAGCEAHELGGLEAISVNLPDEVSELSAVFEAAWPLLAKSQQDHLDALRRYLESRGFIHGRLLGVVDVGYSATIQKCLQVVLNSGMGGYYFVTFEDSEWVRDEFGFAHGCFDHLVDGWETEHPLLTASLFFEAALCALHGQVVGYRRQGELTAAIHASDHRSRNALNAVDALQRGALRYFDEVLALMGPAFLSEAIDTDVALDPLRMILDGPWPPPHTLYSLLTVDDAFSGQSTISVGSVL
jgi:hypothetical protein